MYMDLSDEELTLKFKETGDVKFFEILMDRYKDRIYNFVMRYLSQREDCEDITEDVFVKVYFKISSFNPSKAKFSTWIFTIAKNSVYNKLKERKLISLNYDVVDDRMINNDYDDIVQEGLNKLDKKYRIVLLMYYMEGFKYEEISQILEIPINTVKTRIKRAKEFLKNEIKDYI